MNYGLLHLITVYWLVFGDILSTKSMVIRCNFGYFVVNSFLLKHKDMLFQSAGIFNSMCYIAGVAASQPATNHMIDRVNHSIAVTPCISKYILCAVRGVNGCVNHVFSLMKY